jgi:type I restriction-modification system DNA methylase subunit
MLVDRVYSELPARVGGAYYACRGDLKAEKYGDVPGFCEAAKLDKIRRQGHALTPGQYAIMGGTPRDDSRGIRSTDRGHVKAN